MKEDVEGLVCWMEENQQSRLRGKQSTGHKDAKDPVLGYHCEAHWRKGPNYEECMEECAKAPGTVR